jgi:hypothetical protein
MKMLKMAALTVSLMGLMSCAHHGKKCEKKASHCKGKAKTEACKKACKKKDGTKKDCKEACKKKEEQKA